MDFLKRFSDFMVFMDVVIDSLLSGTQPSILLRIKNYIKEEKKEECRNITKYWCCYLCLPVIIFFIF